MKISITLCVSCSIIIDYTSSVKYFVIPHPWNIFLCCSGVLLITKVVGQFRNIGIFVIKSQNSITKYKFHRNR